LSLQIGFESRQFLSSHSSLARRQIVSPAAAAAAARMEQEEENFA